ncbi:Forkhead box protein B1 [Thelohanellus kitauei]|uniref:Forkhead box protein B1 n=1 Tax=Thelohanellus kitauei TaxID=669202 RepID=A0A0C2NGB8_THEKT|nr:Forkhead box protein B1 [Thelohanellus kitauei]
MNGQTNQRYPSYLIMVIKAILNSPEKRLLLQDIYKYIKHNYPHVISNHVSWQNSVRHNLSTHGCFYRTRNINRGASFWGIFDHFIPYFEKNDFSRRWATGPKRRQETQPILNSAIQYVKNQMNQAITPYVSQNNMTSFMTRNDQLQYQLWNYYLQNPIPVINYSQQPAIQTTTAAITTCEQPSINSQPSTYYVQSLASNPFQLGYYQ